MGKRRYAKKRKTVACASSNGIRQRLQLVRERQSLSKKRERDREIDVVKEETRESPKKKKMNRPKRRTESARRRQRCHRSWRSEGELKHRICPATHITRGPRGGRRVLRVAPSEKWRRFIVPAGDNNVTFSLTTYVTANFFRPVFLELDVGGTLRNFAVARHFGLCANCCATSTSAAGASFHQPLHLCTPVYSRYTCVPVAAAVSAQRRHMAGSDNFGPVSWSCGRRERPCSTRPAAVSDRIAERHRSRGRPNERCHVPSVPGARPFLWRAAPLAQMMAPQAWRIRDHRCP